MTKQQLACRRESIRSHFKQGEAGTDLCNLLGFAQDPDIKDK